MVFSIYYLIAAEQADEKVCLTEALIDALDSSTC
jgi:hypothetical protein